MSRGKGGIVRYVNNASGGGSYVVCDLLEAVQSNGLHSRSVSRDGKALVGIGQTHWSGLFLDVGHGCDVYVGLGSKGRCFYSSFSISTMNRFCLCRWFRDSPGPLGGGWYSKDC